mgnify:FL=1
MGFISEIKHGWELFKNGGKDYYDGIDASYTDVSEPIAMSPSRSIPTRFNSISSYASMIYTRISVDIASMTFKHVVEDVDAETQTVVKNSSLNKIFSVEANIDQSSTSFFQHLVYSLFEEGVVAVVITDADLDPIETGSYKINSLRVGKITQWYPTKVRVKLYNEKTGNFSEVVIPKRTTAIIENPLQNIVGKENPTLERLLQKLSLLDKQDYDMVNERLNMILQLPYPTRTDTKKSIAKERLDDLDKQLKGSKLGIGYISSDEKITQLNRPLNSSLIDEIKYLTDEFLSQLGYTRNVFNGTANALENMVYNNRNMAIANRIKEEFQRKFLTKTAQTQGHRIIVYSDPFKLVPPEQLASIGDSLLRNSILTPNEFRGLMGFGPHPSPMADELYNRNIADSNQDVSLGSPASPDYMTDPYNQNGGNYPMEEQGETE